MTRPSVGSQSPGSVVRDFFGVVGRSRTYGNLAYLLLAFPLAVFYTVFLSTGYALGFGLLPVVVGVPILVGMVLATGVLVAVERGLAVHLLGVDAPAGPAYDADAGVVGTVRRWFRGEAFWRGLGLLVVKSAFGMVAFVVLVTLLATSLALLVSPLVYLDLAWVHVQVGGWTIDTLPEALVASVAGFLLTFASLHALNLLAEGFGRVAAWLLVEDDGEDAAAAGTDSEATD